MTGGGFASTNNYDLQPNKVIIEMTEESSKASSGTSEDSFDKKDMTKLFDEFISADTHRSAGRSNSKDLKLRRLRSASGRGGVAM